MRNINEFAYSIANEIAPDLKEQASRCKGRNFAFILGSGTSLTAGDVREITERTDLTPIFIVFRENTEIDASRYFSRLFDSKILFPRNRSEFGAAVKECQFTVSESILGAYSSLLSHTPVYLNSKSGVCRSFIAELVAMGCSENILIPYTKNRTDIIKKVRAHDSDFSYIINKIRYRIFFEIIEAFNS